MSVHFVKDYESAIERMKDDARIAAWDIMRLNANIMTVEQRQSIFRLCYGRLTQEHYMRPTFIFEEIEGQSRMEETHPDKGKPKYHLFQTVQYIVVRDVKEKFTHKPVILCGFADELEDPDEINWYLPLQYKDRGDPNHKVYEYRESFPYVHLLLNPAYGLEQ